MGFFMPFIFRVRHAVAHSLLMWFFILKVLLTLLFVEIVLISVFVNVKIHKLDFILIVLTFKIFDMKKILVIIIGAVSMACLSSAFLVKEKPAAHLNAAQIDATLNKSIIKYKTLAHNTADSLYPRTIVDGKVKFVDMYDWTSGFFPASLWYLYQFSKDAELKKLADKSTRTLEPLKYYSGTHDLGFMIYCPHGLAYSITADPYYKNVFLKTSQTLITRYNKNAKCIRSWDHGAWQFPVIIDNMMNLEMLMESFKISGDSNLYKVAVAHSNTTLKNHFRDDFSSFHLVDYDTITGAVIKKQTVQGFSDPSAWARGQAWAFYGYLTMYRETKNPLYLKQSIGIAKFFMSHPNLPADAIPYWDFNASGIPNEPRDVAAAAIFASGLMELSEYVKDNQQYISFAEKVLLSLSSDKYFNADNENFGFLLKHATGHKPNKSEIDVPLNYADYYFIEALLRFKKHLNK